MDLNQLIRSAILSLFLCSAIAAQSRSFTPVCSGVNDTAKLSNLIASISSNNGTIDLPFNLCATNTLTIPGNVTLDNTRGLGIKVNAGQVLTVLGPIVNPIGKPMFFGPGTVNFTGNTSTGFNGQALTSDGNGGTSWTTISGGGGGGGLVDSVFGRTGNVAAATGDYTWNQINKTTSSLADITLRSADLLSNGTTGTGQIVLRDSPTLTTPVLGAATVTSVNGLGINTTSGAILSIASAKTFTVSNSITLAAASDGLSGTIPASGTFAMGAGALSISSTSDANVASHTHAISTSSNPGSAAAILASNVSGHLQLTRLGLGTSPTQPLEVNGNVLISASTANLFLKDTSTGFQSVTSTVVTPQNNNSLRSTAFTLGVAGWGINAVGDAEFNNLTSRGEIRASVFKVNEVTATAGTFGVFFSAASLSADAVIPASGSFSFNAKNSDTGGMLFGVGDVVRMKGLSLTGASDTWATITARTNNGTTASYTATLSSGTASTTFPAGLAVVDYGPSGTGFIALSSDGTVGASPNLTMATHAGSPWSTFTTRIRAGNCNGSYGYVADVYCFATGQYGTAGQSWLTVDPVNGVRIGNNTTTLSQVDASGNGSFTGSITASSGVIAGWAINSNRLSNGTTYLASGFDIPAGQVAWFGKSTGTLAGAVLRDSANRQISMVMGSTTLYPNVDIFDGTHHRVVLGGLNAAFESDGSTDSMGLKIWNSSGAKLVEFSDVQNIIGGWSITGTAISTSNVTLSSASGGSVSVASGKVLLDGTGITVTNPTGTYDSAASYKNVIGGTLVSEFASFEDTISSNSNLGFLRVLSKTGRNSLLTISSNAPASFGSGIDIINSVNGSTVSQVSLVSGAVQIEGRLDVNSDTVRITTAKTPASASATCTQGTIAWDASFVYVCVAANTWKRSAISTW